MKVNMTLISDTDERLKTADIKSVKEISDKKVPVNEDNDENDNEDESNRHSRIKSVLLILVMFFGFILFVVNMIGYVNNKRLDNQGQATNVIREMEDIDSFMNGDDGSGSTSIDNIDHTKVEKPTTAVWNNPASDMEDHNAGNPTDTTYANESEEMAALRQETQNALNEAALVRQELKNAEDMLDSSLLREEELQNRLDELSGNN